MKIKTKQQKKEIFFIQTNKQKQISQRCEGFQYG